MKGDPIVLIWGKIVKRLKPCKKSIINEVIKGGRGTGTAMQRPPTACKCLAMGHGRCVQEDCSTVREALRSRLLSSGVNGNYDDVSWSYVLVGSVPLRPRKTPLAVSQGENEVSSKTLERKKIQPTKSFFIWQFPHALDHTSRQALYALHKGDVCFILHQ